VESREQTKKAFEAEALPHSRDLYRVALRLTGDPAKAEDVVQEVYLLAWKAFDRYQRGTNCRAWLFKILFNTVQSQFRKWFNTKLVTGSGDYLEQTLVYTPPLPVRLSDRDILDALEKLSPEYRAVLLLADVEDFSYREIAEALDIPMGTVMSRLSRARGLLRKELWEVARSYGIGKPEAEE